MLNQKKVNEFLDNVDFPCTKKDLVEMAEDENINEDIIDAFGKLEINEFNSATDVINALTRQDFMEKTDDMDSSDAVLDGLADEEEDDDEDDDEDEDEDEDKD